MRIVSLAPSATEILFTLGAGVDIVGRTHECDQPVEATRLPAVTSSLPDEPSPTLDALAAGAMPGARAGYRLDADALAALAPDLVVAPALSGVWAVPEADLRRASPARVVTTDPLRLEEVWSAIFSIGEAVGAEGAAAALLGSIRRRLRLVAGAVAGLHRPRVAMIHWPEPLYAPGRWTPDIIEAAGGTSVLGTPGAAPTPTGFDELAEARPDVVVLALAGMRMGQAQLLLREAAVQPRWSEIVMRARVVAVDDFTTLGRAGPRLIDGIALLAWVLHRPDIFLKPRPGRAAELIEAGWIDVSSLPVQTPHSVR